MANPLELSREYRSRGSWRKQSRRQNPEVVCSEELTLSAGAVAPSNIERKSSHGDPDGVACKDHVVVSGYRSRVNSPHRAAAERFKLDTRRSSWQRLSADGGHVAIRPRPTWRRIRLPKFHRLYGDGSDARVILIAAPTGQQPSPPGASRNSCQAGQALPTPSCRRDMSGRRRSSNPCLQGFQFARVANVGDMYHRSSPPKFRQVLMGFPANQDSPRATHCSRIPTKKV